MLDKVEKLASSGDVNAQMKMAAYYDFHEGGDNENYDEEKVVFWYEKAAKQGNAEAQYMLGLCYLNDYEDSSEEGDDANGRSRCIEWFEKAAKQGHDKAQYELAFCYENEYFVEAKNEEDSEENEKRASFWYYNSAKQGNALAQFKIGERIQHNLGVSKEDSIVEKAAYWYLLSAKQGVEEAQIALAELYSSCELDEDEDNPEETAVYWYKKAAEQGNADAEYALYHYYMDCDEPDISLSKRYLELSAKHNNVEAMDELAREYELGERIVKKDFHKALYWHKKVAEGNYVFDLREASREHSMLQLAVMLSGINDHLALYWLKKHDEISTKKYPDFVEMLENRIKRRGKTDND